MGYNVRISLRRFVSGTASALLAMAVVLSAASSSYAQSTKAPGNSYRISPLRSTLTVNPGQSEKVSVYIQNITPAKVTLKVILNDFVASSKEDGVPNIIYDSGKYAPNHSLKKFMSGPDTVTLEPNERKPVTINISVPSNAQSGGYYGAVRFAPTNTATQDNVAVQGSVSSLILLTVPGNLIENLTLSSFDIMQHGKAATRFGSNDGISTIVRLDNRGNVQLAPFGSVFVQKGKQVIYSAKINDTNPQGLILPGSVRKWDLPLHKLSTFGKYKVSASIGYGGSGQTISVEKTIWIIPSSVIFGFIIGLILLVILGYVLTSALRGYKKRILRQARRGRY